MPRNLARNNEYPDAGHNAPPLVQKAIDQFLNLSDEERDEEPLLYYLLGDSTPAYKMSPSDSEYTNEATGNRRCSNCKFIYKSLYTGSHICSQISVQIQPAGYCRLWKG